MSGDDPTAHGVSERLLITGANGQLGRRLIERVARAEPPIPVRAVVRSKRSAQVLAGLPAQIQPETVTPPTSAFSPGSAPFREPALRSALQSQHGFERPASPPEGAANRKQFSLIEEGVFPDWLPDRARRFDPLFQLFVFNKFSIF